MEKQSITSQKEYTPSSQRALVLVCQGQDAQFEARSEQTPNPKPQDVLVELEFTGICGTDVSLARGHLGKCQSILGHEGVGRVVAVGSLCSKDIIGMRVGVGWLRDACGICAGCVRVGEAHCKTQVFSGRDVPGTFARLTLVPERYLVFLPEGVAPELLAPVMCAGVTAFKALKISDAVPGRWVAVSGAAGNVGSLVVQYGKAMGYQIVAIDGGQVRKEHCLAQGADVYLDYEEEKSLRAAILKKTNGSLCSSIIVCAGAISAYENAFQCLEHGATLIAVGIPPPTVSFALHPLSLIDTGIILKGSLVGTRADTIEAVDFIRRGVVIPKVTVIDVEDINRYFGKIGSLDSKVVVSFRHI